MRILGIDPGLAIVGWSIIDFDKDSNPIPIDFGAIITEKSKTTSERLKEIYEDMTTIVEKYNPEVCGIETLLFYNNATTAIVVGEARGIVLLVLEQHNIPIREFTPLQIKDAVTGYGKADKKQVQEMVKRLCNLESVPQPDDAADAVAVALAAKRVV
jgi:crossover junction endodeoxyribonuclease RuvC